MFHHIFERLQHAAANGQPGRRDDVLVSRRDLSALLREFHRLDQEAREQHRAAHPQEYP